MEHASLEPLKGSYRAGDTVTVHCREHYELYGPPNGRLTCANWMWTPDAISICRHKYSTHGKQGGLEGWVEPVRLNILQI